MTKFYFYCEKYVNDGFWDCLEYGTDKDKLIMNYTINGTPSPDVEEFELMEFEGEYKDFAKFYFKVLDILEDRNLEKLKYDPEKRKGLLNDDVYMRMMERLGYEREWVYKKMDKEDEHFLEWLLNR